MKGILSDFYLVVKFAAAELRLTNDIDKLNSSSQRLHVPLRWDDDGRFANETNDTI